MVFMLSLQDLQGDIDLVNIVEEWDVLVDYAWEKLGFFQINGVGGRFEMRVLTGKIGFKKDRG